MQYETSVDILGKPFPILILVDNIRKDAIVSFSYLDVMYDFTVREWNSKNMAAFVYAYCVYHKLPVNVDLSVEGTSEMICAGARDIVTAIFGIFFARGVNVLNYATYHLKQFANDFSYDSTIMHLACRAIIDTNFFAAPCITYDRITLSQAAERIKAKK